MISLAHNRSIFNAMNILFDRMRGFESPLKRLRGIYLSKGNNEPEQNIIKSHIAANDERAVRADELISAWAQITQNEKVIGEYMSGLEKIMFMTQHKLRKPVTNMIGIADLLGKEGTSTEEINQMVKYIQKSAMDLDNYTRELTGMLSELSQTGKK